MIDRYSDHAANERTFLAWIRTGIATIAFGFVVEKFNLFILTMAEASDAAKRMRLERFSGSVSHYDGLALILVGMAIIVISVIRFARTSRMIDDQTAHPASSVRAELVLSIVLALIVAVLSAHLVYVEF